MIADAVAPTPPELVAAVKFFFEVDDGEVCVTPAMRRLAMEQLRAAYAESQVIHE